MPNQSSAYAENDYNFKQRTAMRNKDSGRSNTTPLTRDVLKNFPKVELHRHLEGTFHLPTLHEISLRNKIEAPKDFAEFKNFVQFPKDSPPDFLKFLSKFKNNWYRSFEDVRQITYNSVRAMDQEGIFYSELRFSPEHFCLHNNFNRMEVTRLVIETALEAAKEAKFTLKFLITFNRAKQTEEEMLQLYKDLSALNQESIVGIDLAGDELNYPPQLFQNFFDHVKAEGKYGITIHAGEVSPPEQIWLAMDTLHANRIGHGTSTIDDEKLQSALISRKVTLEQCITSNFQTGSWPKPETHPLGRLFRRGVPVTINTDDPHIQDCDLIDEYVRVAKDFDFNLEDFIKINHIALEASFLKEEEKKKLTTHYDNSVQLFRKDSGL